MGRSKNASDFSIYAPHLRNMIEMTKQVIGYTDPGKDVYDALLEQCEEGMDQATIDRLFEEVKTELIPLVEQITAKKMPENPTFHAYADPDAQRRVQWLLLDYIGFCRDAGAVGETEHPFTTNFSSKDVRVTNHYYETEPLSAMFSAIHEGGHAIFEQNVNPEYDNTVAGSCCYMGVHESQSRFYENILGRNINFWKPIYEKLGELLPQFKNVTLEAFEREINRVENSMVRTEADEVTYCFHIILRYEMEKAIFYDHVPVENFRSSGIRKCRNTCISLRKMTPKASCRMYIGRTARLGISRPICWAASMTACTSRRWRRNSAPWMRSWQTAESVRSQNGSMRRFTGMEARGHRKR